MPYRLSATEEDKKQSKAMEKVHENLRKMESKAKNPEKSIPIITQTTNRFTDKIEKNHSKNESRANLK